MTAQGPYNASKHLVHGPDALLERLAVLHEHAAVAWDRDVAATLGDQIIVAPSKDAGAVHLGILGYAVDLEGRIFRLVRMEGDPLGIAWLRWQFNKAPPP